MEEINRTLPLSTELENLRKLLLYRREELLNLSLSEITYKLLTYFEGDLKKKEFQVGDLFLEILVRLSQALLIKSRILLNSYENPFEEAKTLDGDEEDRVLEAEERDLFKRGLFGFYRALPLERALEEGVFLAKINGFESFFSFEERGNPGILIKALINLLERKKREKVLNIEFSEKNIEDYIKDLKEYIFQARTFTWEDFLREKGIKSLLELVFYFLSLLFLVFSGACGVYQDEGGIIHIFVKE